MKCKVNNGKECEEDHNGFCHYCRRNMLSVEKQEKFIIEKRSKKTLDLESGEVKHNHEEILYKDKLQFGDGVIKIERWEKDRK